MVCALQCAKIARAAQAAQSALQDHLRTYRSGWPLPLIHMRASLAAPRGS